MTARIMGRWVLTHRPGEGNASGAVLVRGRDAGKLLGIHGFHAPYSGVGKGWVVDDHHLSDVAAIASMSTLGYRLVHEDKSECECSVAPRERRTRHEDPSVCDCDPGPLPQVLVDLLGAEDVEHWHRRGAA